MEWYLIKYKETSTFFLNLQMVLMYDMIYLFIAIGFPPGGGGQ
jgi:hypothetical protein